MKIKPTILFFGMFFVCLSLAFVGGYIVHAEVVKSQTNLPILLQARDVLLQNHLSDPPEPPALEYGMIRGMIDAYGDPHTTFHEPVDHELTSDSLEGSFGGIGVRLEVDLDDGVVLYPLPNTPAEEVGLKDGDRLQAVDDIQISLDTPLNNVQAAIRGPVGETVNLTILRPPSLTAIDYEITREEIQLPSVTWHQNISEPRLGIITINIIAASTSEEIQEAVEDLKSRGVSHFILDLRENRGGLLEAGVDIARLFLREGIVIQQKYRDNPIETYQVKKPGQLKDIPIVVFMNQSTASAAEIIAGALQIHNRAQLIGTETSGKDSIQLVFSLDDGSSINVTAARWWFPNTDIDIGESGLIPDIHISEESTNSDAYIQAAIQILFNQE